MLGCKMHCPVCGEPDSRVIDSRVADGGSGVRRRRECPKCLKRFTTYERLERKPLVIIKKDGRREIFDREKVLNGILKAVEKRPISVEILESITDLIEKEIRDEGYEEVSSSRVGEKVMEKLKELDQVAYVRFASVYREFRDIDQFMEILTTLKTGEKQ